MTDSDTGEDHQSPEWDETPVTLSLIEWLTDTHPAFRVTSHTSRAGFEYRLIQPALDGERYEGGASGEFVSWVSTLSERLQAKEHDGWPDYDCPECGEYIWYDGFDDATTVDGQDEYRSVAHCGVCEFVAISRHDGPHLEAEE